MTDIKIRTLRNTDAQAFQQLRLRALQDTPEAFGSTFEEDSALPLAIVGDRLEHTRTFPARVALGAWDGDALVGFVGCMQHSKRKTRHGAVVWGTYVAPEVRGARVGRRLMDHLVAEARRWPGVERLVLSVVERAAPARRLYASVGFIEFGREPDAFRESGVHDTALHLALPLGDTHTTWQSPTAQT